MGQLPGTPSPRIGDWMETFTGRKFWPLDPRSTEVHPGDIAHALGHLCRFNGHVDPFYSVADHSRMVSRLCLGHPKEGLLHDAAEAYLGDVIRPLKRWLYAWQVPTTIGTPMVLNGVPVTNAVHEFCAVEAALMQEIRERFSLSAAPHVLLQVQAADDAMLVAEAEYFKFNTRDQWDVDADPALVMRGLQMLQQGGVSASPADATVRMLTAMWDLGLLEGVRS